MKKQIITGLLSITFYMLILTYSSIWGIDILFSRFGLFRKFILDFTIYGALFLLFLSLFPAFILCAFYLFSLSKTISIFNIYLDKYQDFDNSDQNFNFNQHYNFNDYENFDDNCNLKKSDLFEECDNIQAFSDLSHFMSFFHDPMDSLINLKDTCTKLSDNKLSDNKLSDNKFSESGFVNKIDPLLISDRNTESFISFLKYKILKSIYSCLGDINNTSFKIEYLLFNEYLRSPVEFKGVYDRASFINSGLFKNNISDDNYYQKSFVQQLFLKHTKYDFFDPGPDFIKFISENFFFIEIIFTINFQKNRLVTCIYKYNKKYYLTDWIHSISDAQAGRVLAQVFFSKKNADAHFEKNMTELGVKGLIPAIYVLPRKVYNFSWDNLRDTATGLTFDKSALPLGLSSDSETAFYFSEHLNKLIMQQLHSIKKKSNSKSIQLLQFFARLRVVLKHTMIITLFFVPLVLPGILTLPVYKNSDYSVIIDLWRWRLVIFSLFPQALIFMIIPVISSFHEKRVRNIK